KQTTPTTIRTQVAAFTPTTVPTPTFTATPSPTPEPTDTPIPTPKPIRPGDVVCTANWSNGLNGWVGSSDWKALNGQLLSDGTHHADGSNAPTIVAPCQLDAIANYAVEAEIQVVNTLGPYPGFGIYARYATDGQGYVSGCG